MKTILITNNFSNIRNLAKQFNSQITYHIRIYGSRTPEEKEELVSTLKIERRWSKGKHPPDQENCWGFLNKYTGKRWMTMLHTRSTCIEKAGMHMTQDQLDQQSYPDVLSKYAQLHLNMLSRCPHFPRIWHPKHNQDVRCSEHKPHLQNVISFGKWDTENHEIKS